MGWLERFASASQSAPWPNSGEFALPAAAPKSAFKVLLVVAHPDDESECAATVYRITHELGGVVDQVVVTDGAGGQHFANPAVQFYGLNREKCLRGCLPGVRRKELIRAGRILGIRHQYFLNQNDAGFTLDAAEGFQLWNIQEIQAALHALLAVERYDLVLTLLPTEGTHGHHKSVAVLTLDAVSQLPVANRPIVAGVITGPCPEAAEPRFTWLDGFASTRTQSAHPVLSFDRRTPLACNRALDYSIVVHWTVAEHKSQGMLQMEYARHTHEYFWQFSMKSARDAKLWNTLAQQQLAPDLVAA